MGFYKSPQHQQYLTDVSKKFVVARMKTRDRRRGNPALAEQHRTVAAVACAVLTAEAREMQRAGCVNAF